VLAIVPAFGLDTLGVAAGLGLAGAAARGRYVAVLACFEGGMPILGAALGSGLGSLAGEVASWAATALLAALGVRAIAEGAREALAGRDDDDEGQASSARPPASGLWALLAAGLSVSVDELGAGLGAGAAGLPLRLLIPALALQAGILTYVGLRAGAGMRRWLGRWGDLLAGAALLAVAAFVGLAALPGRARA
jgi:putative Mn2+ efflux pump MntP